MGTIKVDCQFNDQGAWCLNQNIKRSLLGFGARCCVLYPLGGTCKFRERYDNRKPIIAPPSPTSAIKIEPTPNELELVKKPEYGDDAFGLENSKYHLHTKDIANNNHTIETVLFDTICKTLDIDIDSLSAEKLFTCYEEIYKVIVDIHNMKTVRKINK